MERDVGMCRAAAAVLPSDGVTQRLEPFFALEHDSMVDLQYHAQRWRLHAATARNGLRAQLLCSNAAIIVASTGHPVHEATGGRAPRSWTSLVRWRLFFGRAQ